MPRRFAVVLAWLSFLSLSIVAPAGARQTPAAQQIAPADEQAIQQIVSRLYEARAKRDVPSAAALWAEKAPGRINPRFPANFVFPYERLEVGKVSIANLTQQATTMTARVTAEVTVMQTPVDPPRTDRWIWNMAFIREGDAWLIWREARAAEDLAVEISRATSPEEREKLLNAEPDLVPDEVVSALEVQADRNSLAGDAGLGMRLYELALSVGERAKSARSIARMHLRIGQALQLNPTTKPAAIEHLKLARDGFASLGDEQHVASAEIGLGSTYFMQDDQASREHYQKAVEVLAALPDRVAHARALHSYGNACYMVGDFAAALDAYDRSMKLQEAAGTRAGIPALWQAIGRVQKEQRDYESAIDSYGKSLAHSANDTTAQYGGLTGIADVYRLQGRFELALQQYDVALALTQRLTYDQGTMQVEADIGNVYMSAQQPATAREHYRSSLVLAQKIGDRAAVARALAGTGAACFAEMQYEAALDAYEKALAIQTGEGEIAWLYAHIGLVQSALEKHDEALESYQKAFDLGKELGDRAAIAVMLTLLATEHAEMDQADRALELADAAATAAREIENDDTVARARVVKARVLRKQGERDAAERALQEAIAAVEHGRTRTGDEPPEDFFGDTRGPYRAMALLLAGEGKAADALVFAERAQLGLLRDLLTGNRSLISRGLSDQEREDERRLARQRQSLRVQLEKEQDRTMPDPARLASLQSGLADVERQRAAFTEKIYLEHPGLKLQRGLFDVPAVERLGAAVTDDKTAVLEFVTTDAQTLVLVLTRPAAAQPAEARADVQIDVKTIDIRLIDLGRRVRDYRALVRGRDPAAAKAARDLYTLLLDPVREALARKTRLLVVPDGPLWALPFQALQSADDRYLIQQCAVSYAPSLTALDLLASGALAGPTTGQTRRRIVAVANRQAGSAAGRLKLLNAAANVASMSNAEQEVRRLAQVYGVARAKTYTSAPVAPEAIRTDAQTASALHLATFFVPSAASPMRSPIVFSFDKSGQANVVEAWEMMGSPLPSTVVVSRVQAERVGGEGVVPVGVSWTFFAAGTRTAVLATWPDDSPAAVTLMLGLHRGLSPATGAPASAATALRKAILPLLATKYRDPFYWANYSVVGIG